MNNTEKFAVGLSIATALGYAWQSQKNPPKVYLGGTRVHHYHAGAAIALFGLLSGSPTVLGFGAGLVLDDIDDIPW